MHENAHTFIKMAATTYHSGAYIYVNVISFEMMHFAIFSTVVGMRV